MPLIFKKSTFFAWLQLMTADDPWLKGSLICVLKEKPHHSSLFLQAECQI